MNYLNHIKKTNDKPIKDVLAEYIGASKKLARGYDKLRIEEAWRTCFGPTISSFTSKVYFANGKLEVYLTSAPLRKELSMSKDKIIARLNETLKDGVVKEVVLR